MGAIGAALVSMVAKSDHRQEELRSLRRRAEGDQRGSGEVRAELTAAIDEDVVAFNAVMGAYGLRATGDDQKAARAAAIQTALKQATMRHCARVKACHEVHQALGVVARRAISTHQRTPASPFSRQRRAAQPRRSTSTSTPNQSRIAN